MFDRCEKLFYRHLAASLRLLSAKSTTSCGGGSVEYGIHFPPVLRKIARKSTTIYRRTRNSKKTLAQAHRCSRLYVETAILRLSRYYPARVSCDMTQNSLQIGAECAVRDDRYAVDMRLIQRKFNNSTATAWCLAERNSTKQSNAKSPRSQFLCRFSKNFTMLRRVSRIHALKGGLLRPYGY